MNNKNKYIKYKTLIIVFVIVLLIVLVSLLLSKLVLPLSVILIFIGLLYLSIYYPKKKDDEEIEIVIISKDSEEKKKEELRNKLKDNILAIDIKTIKDSKNEDKVIEIDIVSIKDDKEDKKVTSYIKQENVTEKVLFANNIPKKEYEKAKEEKEVVTKLSESIRKLKDNPTIITKSKEDAKTINKLFKSSVPTKPNYIVTSSFNNKENNAKRRANARKLANNVYNACDKEIKENKIEPLTKEEKLTCAYIKTAVDDKDVKFSKDKDGYINVIGSNSSRIKFKIGKKDKYVVLPKDEAKSIKLNKYECSNEENKNSNIRVVLNKIKDVLIIKNPLIKILKKEKIIKEKKDEYSFNISIEEAKKLIKLEEENKKLLDKLSDINKNAHILHDSKSYNQELKLLNKGINKLKNKNINITNLVIRRNNLLKFLSQEKEKQKQLKKINNNN